MGHFRGLKRPPNWKICHIFPFFGQIRAWNMSAWPLMARNRFSAFKRHHKNVLTYYLFAEIGQTSPQNEPILYPTQQKCWILKLFERLCMTAHDSAQRHTKLHDGARRRTTAHDGALRCTTAHYSALRRTTVHYGLLWRSMAYRSTAYCSTP